MINNLGALFWFCDTSTRWHKNFGVSLDIGKLFCYHGIIYAWAERKRKHQNIHYSFSFVSFIPNRDIKASVPKSTFKKINSPHMSTSSSSGLSSGTCKFTDHINGKVCFAKMFSGAPVAAYMYGGKLALMVKKKQF